LVGQMGSESAASCKPRLQEETCELWELVPMQIIPIMTGNLDFRSTFCDPQFVAAHRQPSTCTHARITRYVRTDTERLPPRKMLGQPVNGPSVDVGTKSNVFR